MTRPSLIQSDNGVQAVQAENIEVRQRVGIEGVVRQRKLHDEPAGSFMLSQFQRGQGPERLRTLERGYGRVGTSIVATGSHLGRVGLRLAPSRGGYRVKNRRLGGQVAGGGIGTSVDRRHQCL